MKQQRIHHRAHKLFYMSLSLVLIFSLCSLSIHSSPAVLAEGDVEVTNVQVDPSELDYDRDSELYYYDVRKEWDEEGIKNGQGETIFSASDFTDKAPDSQIEIGSYGDEDDVLLWSQPGGWIEYDVDIEKEGIYQIGTEYFPFTEDDGGSRQSVILSVEVNGEFPYKESRSIDLKRSFKDLEDQFDDEGNQIRSLIEENTGWKTDAFRSSSGSTVEPLLFHLKEGQNTIRIYTLREAVALKSFTISEPTTYESYKKVKESYPSDADNTGDIIEIEAENFLHKNSTSVQVQYDRDPLTTPKSLTNVLFNTIGGESWHDGNQAITWEFEVPEDGLYKLGFRGLQNYHKNLSVFRTLYIDDEIPFEEMKAYQIPYDTSWQEIILEDEENGPYAFYLEKGKHTMTLEVTHEPFSPLLGEMDKASKDIKSVAEELRLATGDREDSFRVWNVEEELPGLIEQLEDMQTRFEEMTESVIEINGATSDVSQAFKSLAQDVERLLKKPDEIPNKQVTVGRFQEQLEGQRQELIGGPLQIDNFNLAPMENEFPRMTANWFEKLIGMFSSLIYSFSGQNELAEQQDEDLNVWMMWGRDYAEELQQLADQYFTSEHGIKVNVNLIQDPELLILAKAAGIMPDVALGIPSDMPFEMALRDAAQDFSQLEGSEDILDNYAPGTLLPYFYDGGYYGLPETINFKVLFYRKDILDQLNLDIPDTWDDVYDMMPTLLQNQYNFYVDPQDFSYMLYQNGVDLYKDDGMSSGLDDTAGFSAFEEWTDLFNLHGLDLQVESFYQQFRNGAFPVGIADFNDYMELLVAAPEILDVWGIAPLPGHENEDGEIERWAGGSDLESSTSIMLFKDTPEEKQDVAWDFIQWYVSADMQTEYGLNLEQFRGETFRWNSANIDAFAQMPWRQDDLNVILDQWRWIKDPANVPGGYMTIRQLEFAWNNTAINGENPRIELERAVKEINRELRRKQSEFNLLDEDGQPNHTLDLPVIDEPWEGVKRFEQ